MPFLYTLYIFQVLKQGTSVLLIAKYLQDMLSLLLLLFIFQKEIGLLSHKYINTTTRS